MNEQIRAHSLIKKKCSTCAEEKPLTDFYYAKGYKYERRGNCKKCAIKTTIIYNKEHPQQMRERRRKWREANPEKAKKAIRMWEIANPERMREKNQRRRSTPKGNLNSRISSGIRNALKGNKSGYHWENLVNYNVNDLKRHLEKQFIKGMTWDNMREWQIDHIIPISAFNFETAKDIDFKKCWDLFNLCPLWKMDNFKKGNKIIKPFQPSLTI